jgi:hypothetical protein
VKCSKSNTLLPIKENLKTLSLYLTSHVAAYHMDISGQAGIDIDTNVSGDQQNIASDLAVDDQVAAQHDHWAIHERFLFQDGVIRKQEERSGNRLSAWQGEIVLS